MTSLYAVPQTGEYSFFSITVIKASFMCSFFPVFFTERELKRFKKEKLWHDQKWFLISAPRKSHDSWDPPAHTSTRGEADISVST